MSDKLVPVRTVGTRHDAELLRGALEASGIEAMIAADDAGGEMPGVLSERGVVVLVREEDLEAAIGLLGEGA